MTGTISSKFELTSELLLEAYACGIFPMAEKASDETLFWVEPQQRGILPLNAIHIPRRLKRTFRKHPWEIRVDTDFQAVIQGCSDASTNRPQTWINEPIKQLYEALFNQGHCHTIELWQDDYLVAGLYGLRMGAAFFGESMFTRVTDGSKIILLHLIARLTKGGFELLDTQFLTDHLRQFGAIEIPRTEYRRILDLALEKKANFYSIKGGGTSEDILQSINQIS